MGALKIWDAATAAWVYVTHPRSHDHSLAADGSVINLAGAAAGTDVLTTKVTGDALARLIVDADGGMGWSDGTTAKVDLDRGAGFAGLHLTQPGGASLLFVVEGNTGSVSVRQPSDANARLMIRSDSSLLWGDGTAVPDASIQRTAANELTLATGDRIKHDPRGCIATRTSTQAITTSTWTAIQFNATDISDIWLFHDPASNNTRFTVPTGWSGTYLLVGNAHYPTFTATCLLGWGINGADPLNKQRTTTPNTTISASMNIVTEMELNAGDYVELKTWHNQGGNQNIEEAIGAVYYIGEVV